MRNDGTSGFLVSPTCRASIALLYRSNKPIASPRLDDTCPSICVIHALLDVFHAEIRNFLDRHLSEDIIRVISTIEPSDSDDMYRSLRGNQKKIPGISPIINSRGIDKRPASSLIEELEFNEDLGDAIQDIIGIFPHPP
jgi:hypothetical protein